ncbi:MAG TPA: two-component regulator propeller domain-containing protein [Ohtaekwangia sp.]|nr:two-component regulator propeller domain-containing protein [Ohtaekwangia sp.]
MIWIASLSALAQPEAMRFEHFTIQDGLSQSQPFCILQDSRGYLWIGTQDGLNRFDGHTFKVYKNDPFDSTTLTHNWVWTVEEDDHGDLWIGTFQGLCKYLRAQDRFVQYYHNPKDSSSISGNRPNYILKDNRGRLWISSWGNGLNLYDRQTNSFRRFQATPDKSNSLSDNAVRTLYCDKRGNIWIGTWNGGLNKVIEEGAEIRFVRYNDRREFSFDGGKRITTIAEDGAGNLWIGSYEAGLHKLDPATNEFTRIPDLPPNDINKIIRDANGNMWIGTNNGLRIFNAREQAFRHYLHNPTDPFSISSNTIYALTEDRKGIVWIAANGLDQYDPRKNLFETYQHRSNDPASLSQNMVWSFCEDDEGHIWIGTESGPVNVFDPKTKVFRHITMHDDRGNVAENIHRIVFHKGVLWLASYKSGLVRYEKKTGKTRFYLNDHPSALGKIALINEVLADDDGTVWVGSSENGLIHFDPATGMVKSYLHDPADPASIGANFVNALYKDTRGNIWIGFWGGGMSMFNRSTEKFTNYHYDRKDKTGLSDQVVISMAQENDSIFWICTHTGLNRLNINTGRFRHFFEKDGLSNNVVYEMLRDDHGYYWISSDRGINKLDPRSFRVKNYTTEDGLQSNEFNSNAALKTSTGDFYFGGVNGFNVFRPLLLPEDKTPPALVIESYAIHDKKFPARPSVVLAHDENYVSFSFAALEFSAPDKIKYSYRLEGFDREWNAAGNKREATYTNLDPGKYTFRVKAANPDGYWTEPGIALAITIDPPFWKTWWFTSLMVIATASLMYGFHRYRLYQSLKVERLRNKIASDLHDEVGSSLTRISIYSDLLQNEEIMGESRGYLKNINILSREVVSTMSDIVWSIDNRSDTLGALVMRMKDFATEVLQSKNIDLDFKADLNEKVPLDPAQKQNIYLIFKEALNNIVKHAAATRVIVMLSNRDGEFSMQISDNGKGCTASISSKGHGLRNMQRRATAIGGQFYIKNTIGTTVLVKRNSF